MWRNLFILYFVFVKKQRTIEHKKKRSKISALESCYANRFYGTFGVEMRAYGQKLVKFCTQTHRRVNLSSKDNRIVRRLSLRLNKAASATATEIIIMNIIQDNNYSWCIINHMELPPQWERSEGIY